MITVDIYYLKPVCYMIMRHITGSAGDRASYQRRSRASAACPRARCSPGREYLAGLTLYGASDRSAGAPAARREPEHQRPERAPRGERENAPESRVLIGIRRLLAWRRGRAWEQQTHRGCGASVRRPHPLVSFSCVETRPPLSLHARLLHKVSGDGKMTAARERHCEALHTA